LGFAVTTANTETAGREALTNSPKDAQPFTVAILDEDCKNIAVAEFAGHIRQQTASAGTRLIMLAAREPSSGDEAADVADARLKKPLRQSQLFAAIVKRGNATMPPAEATKPATLPESPRPARILVAEDNEINQIVTTQVLSKVGYKCDLVANGKEALQALTEKRYDLVLMDCQMPEMDGFEATRQYRTQESTRTQTGTAPVPIIALTANAMSGDRERCLEAGMTDYLTKPINPVKLIDLVQQYLDEVMAK
jgi:CheY-like chemotaxis protein